MLYFGLEAKISGLDFDAQRLGRMCAGFSRGLHNVMFLNGYCQ